MNNSDPFLEVQADVQILLTSTRHAFSSFLRIRSISTTSSSSSASPELLQSRAELLNNLSTLQTDLEDLLESVKAVEHDPYRFGLDVAEVQRRRNFVRDVSAEVESMSMEINTGSAAGGVPSGTGKAGLPNPAQFDDVQHHNDSDEDGDGDDPYGEFEAQQQETMFREQDAQLDDITSTVGRLRGQAADMGRELEEQTGMLDEVDVVADRVGGKLQTGLKRVADVARRNEEKYSGCCIGVLIAVLIFLLVVLIII